MNPLRRWRARWTIALVWSVALATAAATPWDDARLWAQTPDSQSCSSPGAPFGGEFGTPPLLQDTIVVTDDLSIQDLHVRMEITHAFIGDVVVELFHDGSTVRLHDEQGFGEPGIDATYHDSGAPSGSEPFGCECFLEPSGPGQLADLVASGMPGDWILTVEDVFPTLDDGVLVEWCLDFYQVFPPTPPPPIGNLLCFSPPGSGIVQAAWTNSAVYEEFQVFIDGEFETTLPGSAIGYSSPPQSIPSIVDVTIRGVVGGVTSPPRTCSVGVADVPDIEQCVISGDVISSDLLPVVSPMLVTDPLTIGDLQVSVDITHTFIGDLSVSITSPGGTTVVLHEQNGGFEENIDLTYWQFGVPNGSDVYSCGCFMEPAGPGVLTDFVGGSTVGTWTLLVVDSFAGDSGVLNEWCLRAFEDTPVFPVQDLTCASSPTPGVAEVTWTNTLLYDEIDILIDGVLETTLTGPFGPTSAYSTPALPAPGEISICVVPRLGGIDGPLRCCDVDVILSPVENLSVSSVGGSGVVDASWTNPIPYDSVLVSVNGAAPAVLPGDATSFSTGGMPFEVGAEVCVQGFVTGFGASPENCAAVMVLDAALIEECSAPAAPISSNLPPVTDIVTVTEDLVIFDLEVAVSISHTFTGDLVMELTSPTGTTLRLHDTGGGPTNDIVVLYDDEGVENGSVPYSCGCVMQPSGVAGAGTMADLTQARSAGDWTLTIIDELDLDEGTLDSWCLRIMDGCEILPPVDLACEPQPGGEVVLAWTNGDGYAAVEIERNGLVIDALTGGATSYVDTTAAPGMLEYRIIGYQPGIVCGSPSLPCRTAFGITDVIFRGELPSVVDSTAALRAGLEANGRVVLVTDSLTLDEVTPPESDVEVLWVQLGTFPDNHALTEDEGFLLAELHTGDVGLDGTVENPPLPLYLEGADIWGFDAPTAIADYDGIDNGVIDDGDDSLFALVGMNSLMGLDLGDGSWDAPYVQDQASFDWTDQLIPAVVVPDLGGPSAGAVWHAGGGVDPYNVGVFYNSNVAPVISQSFEIGGYGGVIPALVDAYVQALTESDPIDPPEGSFRRGDADADGTITLGDAIFILLFLFEAGAAAPSCGDTADVNDDGLFSLTDGMDLLSYLFLNGGPPAPPGPLTCGPDPVDDAISACVYDACP